MEENKPDKQSNLKVSKDLAYRFLQRRYPINTPTCSPSLIIGHLKIKPTRRHYSIPIIIGCYKKGT